MSFQIKADGLIKKLGLKAFNWRSDVIRAMGKTGDFYIAYIQRTQMSGRPALRADLGTLRQSWFRKVYLEPKDIVTKVATMSKYARIHQYGGTIRPKKAKWLTIPMHRDAQKHFAGDFPDLQFIRTKSGQAFLVRKKKDHLDFMFMLRKSVSIPKRLHVIERMKDEGMRILNDQMAIVTERLCKP